MILLSKIIEKLIWPHTLSVAAKESHSHLKERHLKPTVKHRKSICRLIENPQRSNWLTSVLQSERIILISFLWEMTSNQWKLSKSAVKQHMKIQISSEKLHYLHHNRRKTTFPARANQQALRNKDKRSLPQLYQKLRKLVILNSSLKSRNKSHCLVILTATNWMVKCLLHMAHNLTCFKQKQSNDLRTPYT